MSVHPLVHPRFTKADWDRLPEKFPAQLVDGFLMKDPAPTYEHQWLQTALIVRLASLVPAGRALVAPCDVVLDPINVYQPDLVVLRGPVPRLSRNVGIPLLAIEILSPSTAVRDRRLKTPRLLRAGVGEVWLIDPNAESIEIHDADGVRTGHGADRLVSRVLPGFEAVPAELFTPPPEA